MGQTQAIESNSPFAKRYKHLLNEDQYSVCYMGIDEPAHINEYSKTFEDGIYVSTASLKGTGEMIVLFSSRDKFDIGIGHCCFYKPAVPLRRKKATKKKFELVEKLNYYQSEYKNQFQKMPPILSREVMPSRSDGIIARFIREKKDPHEMDEQEKMYKTRTNPTIGGGPKWSEVHLGDAEEEEQEEGFEVDPLDKNFYLFENHDFKGNPQITAQVSCINDHAHVGYIVEDCKNVKDGLGKR